MGSHMTEFGHRYRSYRESPPTGELKTRTTSPTLCRGQIATYLSKGGWFPNCNDRSWNPPEIMRNKLIRLIFAGILSAGSCLAAEVLVTLRRPASWLNTMVGHPAASMCGSTATTAGTGTATTGNPGGGNAGLGQTPVGSSTAGFTVAAAMSLLKDSGARTPRGRAIAASTYSKSRNGWERRAAVAFNDAYHRGKQRGLTPALRVSAQAIEVGRSPQ